MERTALDGNIFSEELGNHVKGLKLATEKRARLEHSGHGRGRYVMGSERWAKLVL